MDIFESLENLNVSEECFGDIIGLVEMHLSEDIDSAIDTYAKDPTKRKNLKIKAAKVRGDAQSDHDISIKGRGGRANSTSPERDRPIGMTTDIDMVEPAKTLPDTYRRAARKRRNAEYKAMVKSAVRNAKKNGKPSWSVHNPLDNTSADDKITDYVTKNYKQDKFRG